MPAAPLRFASRHENTQVLHLAAKIATIQCSAQQRLDQCRQLLGVPPRPNEPAPNDAIPAEDTQPQQPCPTCPACQRGKLVVVELVPPTLPLRPRPPHMLASRVALAKSFDTS